MYSIRMPGLRCPVCRGSRGVQGQACRVPEDTDQGVGGRTAKTVKQPRQQPARPQYANYWAPLTRKQHTIPHSAQPQHTNYWAPQTRKRHQQEHRPQQPTERSDPTQHAKGRTGECPGPRKGATTRRNVKQGGGGVCTEQENADCNKPLRVEALQGATVERTAWPSRQREVISAVENSASEGMGEIGLPGGGGVSFDSTAPAHQRRAPPTAETTPAGAPAAAALQNAATRRNMRRGERVTVQGPIKKQRPRRPCLTGGHSSPPKEGGVSGVRGSRDRPVPRG